LLPPTLVKTVFMKLWNDKDRQKGVITSVVIHLFLLLIFMFFGLSYLEPKPEDGIVINFGNSATGMGDQADGAPVKSQPVKETQPTPTEETSTPDPSPTEAVEQTATQDVVEAPSIDESQPKAEKQPEKEEPKKPTPEELEQQRLEKERAEKRRQLEERFGKVSDAKAGGEGEAGGAGDQGSPDGDKNSPNRTGGATGGGGAGGSGNYLLGNRQALNKPRPEYQCDDQGRVVVKIYVNRQGKVTRAVPGEKVPNGAATTTTSGCLYDKAKAAALRTTWQGDADAPSTQIGYIIYNFQKQ